VGLCRLGPGSTITGCHGPGWVKNQGSHNGRGYSGAVARGPREHHNQGAAVLASEGRSGREGLLHSLVGDTGSTITRVGLLTMRRDYWEGECHNPEGLLEGAL
jgi:hypothetical protein